MRRVRNYLAAALLATVALAIALNILVQALIQLWPILLGGVIATTFILTLLKRLFW
jgi:hypothetical protein